MRENSIKTRLAVGAGGLIAAGGLVVFSIAGATGAMATPPPPFNATGTTSVSATVYAASSLVDNTPAITFPTALPGGGAVNANIPVSLTAQSNDINGFTTDAQMTPTALTSGANTIPNSATSGLSVTGNDAIGEYLGDSGFAAAPGQAIGVDNGVVGGPFALSDTWMLTIPAAQTAGTYTGVVQYTMVPN